jgi:hypothetical protein
MPDFRIENSLIPVAEWCKEHFPSLVGHVDLDRVCFLTFGGESDKRPKVLGRCRKVTGILTAFVPAGNFYVIDLWYGLAHDLPMQRFVMLHELYHIEEGGTDPQSNSKGDLRPHDFESFLLLEAMVKGNRNLIGQLFSDNGVSELKETLAGLEEGAGYEFDNFKC